MREPHVRFCERRGGVILRAYSTLTAVAAPASVSPEFSDRPRRRTFTAKDKPRILTAADQAAGTGGIGAILRREAVYSSTLCDWRRRRDAGAFRALSPGKRGPKPPGPTHWLRNWRCRAWISPV